VNDGVLDKVRQAVSDVFGVPAAEITADSSPQTVEAWDSMGHLNLILALEQSFGVQFSPEEIAVMTSVRLAADTLSRKGAA
jgi:acyl carrier protein